MKNITNQHVTDFINNYYKPLNESLDHMRAYAEENRIPIIQRDTEQLLLQFIKIKKPKKILEIGTAIGYSAACFAMAAEGSRIVTIESNADTYDQAAENLADFGLSDRVQVMLGDGEEVMQKLLHKTNVEGLDQFDFIFIDASKSHYRRFWDVAIKLIKDGGVIACDNILMKARTVSDEYDPEGKYRTNIRSMRDFVEYITDLDNVDTAILPVGDGVSISIVHLNR